MSDNTQRYLLDVPCNGDLTFFTHLSMIKEKAAELQKVAADLQSRIELLENSDASIKIAIEVPKEKVDYSKLDPRIKILK